MINLRHFGLTALSVAVFSLATNSVAQSNVDFSAVSTVVLVESYNSYGGGDVFFKIASPAVACADGYWLTKADPGFTANMAIIVSAYQAKSPVRAAGLVNQLWAGSGGKFCKLDHITLS
jgi:hypothetical protein